MEFYKAKYFSLKSDPNLACPCCGLYIYDPWLLFALDWAREEVNCPVHVLSGTRCPKHHQQIYEDIYGSRWEEYIAVNSMHLFGKAADVTVNLGKLEELHNVFRRCPAVGGLKVYYNKRFIHVDVRHREPVTW